MALIDTAAVADFQTATEIEAIVAVAIAALPEYQTLAQVNTLITTAIDALTLGQTAAEVQDVDRRFTRQCRTFTMYPERAYRTG